MMGSFSDLGYSIGYTGGYFDRTTEKVQDWQTMGLQLKFWFIVKCTIVTNTGTTWTWINRYNQI